MNNYFRIIILIIISQLIVVNFYSFAQKYPNSLEEFTGLKIGDKINLFDKSKESKSHIYLFVDDRSCYTCISGLSFFNQIHREGQSQVTLFASGVTEEYLNNLKDKFDWVFNIIIDNVGAYQKYYFVRNTPFMIITDSRGIVKALDKASGALIKPEDVIGILKVLEQQEINTSNLIEIKRVRVKDTTDLMMSGRRIVRYSKQAGKFVAFDNKDCQFYVFDSTGSISLRRNIELDMNLRCQNIWDVQFGNKDTLLFYLMDNKASRYMIYFDTEGRKLWQYPIQSLDTGWWANLRFCYVPEAGNIFIGMGKNKARNNKNDIIRPDFQTIQSLDKFGIIRNMFGKPNKEYLNKYYSKVLDNRLISNGKGSLFEAQNLSTTINQYDSNYTLIKAIDIHPTDWRYKDYNYAEPKEQTLKELAIFRNNTSWVHDLLIDKEKNYLGLLYLNNIFPENIIDPFSSEVQYDWYLHRFSVDGKPVDKKDILMPKNSLPIIFDGNILIVSELIEHHLELVWYKINND